MAGLVTTRPEIEGLRAPHPRGRHPARRRRRPDRHARRLGRPSARPRRRRLRRPARRLRGRPGRRPRRGPRAWGAHDLRNEYCVQVTGEVVRAAPRATRTPTCPPARSRSTPARSRCSARRPPLPFQVDEHVEVGEEARLKHRYLDLRRPGPAGAAMRLRREVNTAARTVLDAHDFVEIETPTLTRSTPEGARDFLVPGPAASPAPGTPCRRARSCSSSCSWSPAWSGTTRSPAATATRTSAPTGSRSSPSSTSR